MYQILLRVGEEGEGMLSPVVCKNYLMHVGGTAFIYTIYTFGGGLFFIVFVDIWKLLMQNLQAINYIR